MCKDRAFVEAVKSDPETAPLSQRQRALVVYASKLTLRPSAMVEGDIGRLRQVGLTDAEILDLCQVTCYYAFANRLAQGLGIELES